MAASFSESLRIGGKERGEGKGGRDREGEGWKGKGGRDREGEGWKGKGGEFGLFCTQAKTCIVVYDFLLY